MLTSSDVAGATAQKLWDNAATISGGIVLVLAVFLTLYLLAPVLFSHRTNPFWETLLAPVLVAFQWLGVFLPRRGPWRRYVYRPGHLAVVA